MKHTTAVDSAKFEKLNSELRDYEKTLNEAEFCLKNKSIWCHNRITPETVLENYPKLISETKENIKI